MSFKYRRGNIRKNKIKASTYENGFFDQNLVDNIEQSIDEYINKDENSDNVSIGLKFCEWCLYNLFELREDEVLEASEIGGKYDNGIDAVFEINDELYIIQCKYSSSHSIDAMSRFKDDCERLLTQEPLTDREVVKEKCAMIRTKYNNKETIHCYYITNSMFESLDKNHLNKVKSEDESNNIRFYFHDVVNMTEKLEEAKGLLPKKYRNKQYQVVLLKSCEMDNNTLITSVGLKEFGRFVKKGDKMLYVSNIRNYLKKTKINRGIENTIENEPEKFWYYNNGVTIVCKDYYLSGSVVQIIEPQIVNGCQTAKSIMTYYNGKTQEELKDMNNRSKILVKIIRTTKRTNNENENEIKLLKDNITRYTNSQNAVRGLDFYALDEFEKDLKKSIEKYGYYYEIQRGAYITLNRLERSKFKGCSEYNYLLPKKCKYVLTVKEVMQSFTAGLKQLPNIAYGHASELTPIGSKWSEICNEETKKLPIEHFLFPNLLLKYIKNNMGYKSGANSFRKSSSLLFITTYYKYICELMKELKNEEYETPLQVDIDLYKKIFSDKKVNESIISTVDQILEDYMEDSKIEDYISDSLKDFLKTGISKKEPKEILEKKIKKTIIKARDRGELKEIEELILNRCDIIDSV